MEYGYAATHIWWHLCTEVAFLMFMLSFIESMCCGLNSSWMDDMIAFPKGICPALWCGSENVFED